MAQTYTTVQGDTWDMIARETLGSEAYVSRLQRANMSLLDYFVFPAGKTVIIPEIPDEEAVDMPDWRQ